MYLLNKTWVPGTILVVEDTTAYSVFCVQNTQKFLLVELPFKEREQNINEIVGRYIEYWEDNKC